MNNKRYVPKKTYKVKPRIRDVSNNNMAIITNLSGNLKSDYLGSIELLFEYFNHKNNLGSTEVMKIINLLCMHLPLNNASIIINDTKYIDHFCRFISLLCISHNIEWDKETMNLFISTLIDTILRSMDILLSLVSYLPNILRTVGHVLFERGYLINAENRDNLMSLLIPLCLPKNKNKININLRILSIHENVDKLCIYYGIKKFSQSQNIETFQSAKEIYQYIQECNKNKIVIHQKIREVWKYYINIRKFSIIALGHCIIKSMKTFHCYKHLISNTMLNTFNFLKKEYKNYPNNKLCRNQHDFAKSLTPIIRSLAQLFNHFDFDSDSDSDSKQEFVNNDDDDLIIQIIEDLKDLMTLGTTTATTASTIIATTTDDNNNNLLAEYNEYSKKDRHRYRNRVLLDWNGEQYKNRNGYTSDSVLILTDESSINAENINDKSFFVPFDIFSKLRMYCQHSLGLLVKKITNSNNNYFTLFWNKLLPKDITSAISTRPFYGCNIFTILLYDPHPRVRNAACLTLYNLLEICATKINNLVSKSKSNKSSNIYGITTISDRANQTLLAMHKGLLFGIEEKETMTTPRTQIIKCLILLINITDYNNMISESDNKTKSNILLDIISIILKDICIPNGLYKSAVITLLSSIFCVNYSFNEEEEKRLEILINNIMPMLLQEIKKCSGPNPSSCDPRSILVSLAKNYRKYLSFWWNKGLKDVIHTGFNPMQHYTIILETIKLINAWISIITNNRNSNSNNDKSKFNFFNLPNAAKALSFWLDELLKHLNIIQTPDAAAIKSKICILFSSFKSDHFNLFDIQMQYLFLDFLSNCLCDKNYPSVRQCSCKAAGNILTFNLNTNNLQNKNYYQIIVTNLLAIISIKCKKKQEYLLVSKGCCAIANICNYNSHKNKITMKQLFIYNSSTNANDMMHDMLENDYKDKDNDIIIINKTRTAAVRKPALVSLIGDELLIQIVNKLIQVVNMDKHNISYNAIRAIGNISYFLSIDKMAYRCLWSLICASISHCLLNDKKLKNQWNGCFAAGNALSNNKISLLSDKTAMESTRDLYFSILSLLDKCENYKVKITCCYALTCPVSKANYGPIYYKLIKRTTNALNNIDKLEANGYAKQKYKQLLKFRLIVLLSHLIGLFYNDNNNKKNDQKKINKLKQSMQLNDKNILNKLHQNYESTHDARF